MQLHAARVAGCNTFVTRYRDCTEKLDCVSLSHVWLSAELGLLVSYRPLATYLIFYGSRTTLTARILQVTLLGNGSRDKVENHTKRVGVAVSQDARRRGVVATV